MFPFLGSLPQTTNLVVCVCGGQGKLPNALVVYPKLPIWFVNWAKLAVPSHSEPLQWEKIGKVVNWAKLDVQSHSKPLQWVKIENVANRAKLAIQSHFEPLCWEKIGKVANWAKLAVLSHSEHFGRKRLEIL